MRPRVLAVAGSDSGGGAGIEADIKTIAALGGYAMTAITALTAQNTLGVAAIHPVPPAFVAQAIGAVLGDLGADAVKIGMLGEAALIEAVGAALPDALPVVLDPVMVATSGARLLPAAAVDALIRVLVPRALIVTPNLPEAEALSGIAAADEAGAVAAGHAIRALGARAVLVKGGHGAGETVVDVLVHEGGVLRFSRARIATRHTHGTGCTLSSAIATGIGAGLGLEAAVGRAVDYVHRAILAAPGFGRGHGPLGHWASPPAGLG